MLVFEWPEALRDSQLACEKDFDFEQVVLLWCKGLGTLAGNRHFPQEQLVAGRYHADGYEGYFYFEQLLFFRMQ